MKNTLQTIECFERYKQIQKDGYTAHDYQTSEFVQNLIPFLEELQSTIEIQQREIEYLQNRVEQLDRLI